MRSTPVLLAAVLVLAGCQSPAEPEAPPAWDAPSEDGPVLIGTVRHPDGTPLEGIEVTTHAGFATRLPVAKTTTNARGRFRFDPVEGSTIFDENGKRQHYVGVCVGSVRNANPPEFLPWRDLRIGNEPGTVERADFEFDPESIPPEYRTR